MNSIYNSPAEVSMRLLIILSMTNKSKDIDTLTVAESFSTARYLVEKQRYNKNKVFLLPNGADKSVFFRDEALRKTMRCQYKYQPHR